jgi:hypothetical protein
MTEEEIDPLIAENPEERNVEWDWASARVVMPEPK